MMFKMLYNCIIENNDNTYLIKFVKLIENFNNCFSNVLTIIFTIQILIIVGGILHNI